MDYKIYCVLILILLRFCEESDANRNRRFPAPRGFLVYRTVSITQKSCTSVTSYSYSCCQRVTILYTKAEKNLCVNFTYQSNGLNVDVSLESIIIKARTVTDYKPLKFCVYVPGCLFSSACVDVLELNRFPRSITACLRLDIFSKKKLWQINYDCISISTELSTTPNNATMQMMTSGNTMAMPPMMTSISPTMASMSSVTTSGMTPMMTAGTSSMMATGTSAKMTSSATTMMTSNMPSMMGSQTTRMPSMTTAGTMMPRNQTMMTTRARATGELEALESKEAITESMMNNND